MIEILTTIGAAPIIGAVVGFIVVAAALWSCWWSGWHAGYRYRQIHGRPVIKKI